LEAIQPSLGKVLSGSCH